MEVKQVSTLINTAATEMGAAENVVSENLEFVDNGAALSSLIADDKTLDGFVKSLHEHVGKVEFYDAEKTDFDGYGLIKDSWTYGGLMQKVYIDLPTAKDNGTFDLVAGQKYDDILVYTPPTVHEKYFDKVAPWEISMSYADPEFVRRSFSNAEQANGFMSAIENKIGEGRKFYNLITESRTVNSLILESAKGGKVMNLLAMYNSAGHPGEANALTRDVAITNKNYLRFAASKIAEYSDYMNTYSTAFNAGGYYRRTPKSKQKFFALSHFARMIEVYSESDTYHNEFVKLINAKRIPNWQGTKYETRQFDFETVSTVYGVPASGSDSPLLCTGIVGILMDERAAAVCNERYRVTSFFNAGNETLKYYHKWDARYITDTNENTLVFGMWDTENPDVTPADESSTKRVKSATK